MYIKEQSVKRPAQSLWFDHIDEKPKEYPGKDRDNDECLFTETKFENDPDIPGKCDRDKKKHIRSQRPHVIPEEGGQLIHIYSNMRVLNTGR